MKRFFSYLSLFLAVSILITACAGIDSPNDESDESSSAFVSEDSVIESVDMSVIGSDDSGSEESFEASAESSDDVSFEVSSEDSNMTESVSPPVNEDNSVGDIGGNVSVPADQVFISNGILISGTRGMEQYFGGINSGAQCCKMIGDFKNDLGDGVEVYTVVAPHASCYYAPEKYSNLIERGEMNFDNLTANTAANVHFVDTYNALWKHVDEPIYPRTEFHWGALAAYYAAEEFAKVANVSFPSLDSYQKIVKPGFVGSAYTFSKAAVIKNNPEDFLIFMPQTEYTAYYYYQGNYDWDNPNSVKDTVVFDVKSYAGAFLCGDTYTIKIVTKNNTGRKLVIFKDSYGNAFAPFTIGSFDEIYIVDMRYYGKNGVKLCQEVGATDVVFAMSAFTATGVVYSHIDRLRTIA